MWTTLAHFVLKARLFLIIIIGIFAVFMAYHASKVEMTYDFVKVLPPDDPDSQYFTEFKQTFGEDANILVVGFDNAKIYTKDVFNDYFDLSNQLHEIEGVNEVISLPLLVQVVKDTENKTFKLEHIFTKKVESQDELDSLIAETKKSQFYEGQIVNYQTGATNIAISINKEILNSANRQKLVDVITELTQKFADKHQLRIHYAGLPYVRSYMTSKVRQELNLFMMLAGGVTGIILLLFFRSIYAVIFPLLIVGIVVVTAMGMVVLMGYKLSLLSGIIPPLIIVIGIPNCIYLLTKYHYEFRRHGNKIRALSTIIRKIGIVALITNATTSVGFGVYLLTNVSVLREFGLIAGTSVIITFIVSIILIPAFFSYLPEPNERQLKHLDSKFFNFLLTLWDKLVFEYRNMVFLVSGFVVLIGIWGILKINVVSYMIDDIPKDSSIMDDMRFFERHFRGVMPLEIIIDTGKKKAVQKISNLRKIEKFQDILRQQPELSSPVSVNNFYKASTQAYFDNNMAFYRLPTNNENNFILGYLKNQKDDRNILRSFVDSTGQKLRISLKVADIGTKQMDILINEKIKPAIDEIFADSGFDIKITGTTLLFLKGNRFLINNLYSSLALAFVLIAFILAILFRRSRIIIISIIPNLIPLVATAGIMGYFGIPIKPSTAIIFSIAFGISVDDSIHFLARYRQQLLINNFNIPNAVSVALKETGPGMMYTSVVLFFGFVIFAFSDFGGTKALGILTSITLGFAMLTNLTVLPALLLAYDTGKFDANEHPLIEHYDEFHLEEDDDELDLSKLEISTLDFFEDDSDPDSEK
jgi:uncharacterized protein